MNRSPESIAVDLTSLSPAWMDSKGLTAPIAPLFCLPAHPGEPPIVGNFAAKHRRGSSPALYPAEARFTIQNRSRWHLAEGWMRLCQEPDSLHLDSAKFTWSVPGGEELSIGFEEVLRTLLQPFAERSELLALIIPDSMGPGAQQYLLDGLHRLPARIQLFPRSIAIALDWIERLNGNQPDGASLVLAGKDKFLVTSAAWDFWESSLFPFRNRKIDGKDMIFPVRDRTARQGDSMSSGLFWYLASSSEGQVEEPLRRLLVNDSDQQDALLGNRPVDEFPESLPRLLGIDLTERRSSSQIQTDQIIPDDPASLVWLHSGYRAVSKAPGWMGSIFSESSVLPEVVDSLSAVRGGQVALRMLDAGLPPYYEALSSLGLYVQGRNKYEDPVPEWLPLISKGEVPAGQEYRSPEPIKGLQLQAHSEEDIPLFLQWDRAGRWVRKSGTAPVRKLLEEAVDLEVEARMQPGQGLARVEIRSCEKGIFSSSLRMDRLEDTTELPAVQYAWPPGSSCVVSADEVVDEAIGPLQNFLTAAENGFPSTDEFKQIREQLNTWSTPESRAQQQALPDLTYRSRLQIPEDVHESFVYVGAIPSGHSGLQGEMRELVRTLTSTLQGIYAQATPSQREKVLWLASWLYLHLPKGLLEGVRSDFVGRDEPNGGAIACAGQCFSEGKDFKSFFSRFTQLLRGPRRSGVAPSTWLRAYRNLARFRSESLRLEYLSIEDQSTILEWYLDLFDSSLENPGGHGFLYSAYMAPHILKRRRYDSNFLEEGTRDYFRFNAILDQGAQAAISDRHRQNCLVAREFLSKTATQATIEKLGTVDKA